MNEQKWLSSTDPEAMLRYLSMSAFDADLINHPGSKWLKRKLRLFREICAEQTMSSSEAASVLRCIIGTQMGFPKIKRRVLSARELLLPRSSRPMVPISQEHEEISVPPLWLAWHERTIPRLTQAIYDERAFERMGILGDALEEAGCTNTAMIEHCRDGGPHCRGCWVLDVLLGKE